MCLFTILVKKSIVAKTICKGHGLVGAAWEAQSAGDIGVCLLVPHIWGWNSFWECFKEPNTPQVQGDFH